MTSRSEAEQPTPQTATFRALATRAVDDLLARDPVEATSLGDHRHDDRLPDWSPEGLEAERRAVSGLLAELDGVDVGALDVADAVDAETLRTRLQGRQFELDELRLLEWDPLEWNPSTAAYLLLARDFAPLADRLRSLAGRLAQVPEHLDLARRTLGEMARVHVETAIGQFTGTRTLLAVEVERALGEEPGLRGELEPVRDRAVQALEEHVDWLRRRLEDGEGVDRDPRLGPELFARRLALRLDAQSDPDTLLARAEADLALLEERIGAAAARVRGSGEAGPDDVRDVLDAVAAEGPVDDTTVVELCERALRRTTDFVRTQDLVTVHDDPVEVIVMPEIHRGVAVAYCDPPGPLEQRPLPTYVAVSPTPEGWSAERVRSFYREYNAHALHNLMVHEAMPGHVLQLAHSRRYRGATPVRSAFWSGPFVEGWAVYAERLMADAGYEGAGSAEALRLQQLKMAMRATINTILDVRVHCHGMTEDEAMALMTERGHQEEGEAAGKWRRALLTSAQLSTYYVGATEVSDVVSALRSANPAIAERELHDRILAHGSPSPRHLRTLLRLG
jgi:uncharacterized protein (DUF885 family)